jgi:hypothetical protein
MVVSSCLGEPAYTCQQSKRQRFYRISSSTGRSSITSSGSNAIRFAAKFNNRYCYVFVPAAGMWSVVTASSSPSAEAAASSLLTARGRFKR